MKQKLFLFGFEEAETSNGKKYWKVQTNKGEMSLWDAQLFEAIGPSFGSKKLVEVDTQTKGKYTNIVGYGETTVGPQPASNFAKKITKFTSNYDPSAIEKASKKKYASMCLAYSLQWSQSRLAAITTQCKTKDEVEAAAKLVKQDIFDTAKGFYNAVDDLVLLSSLKDKGAPVLDKKLSDNKQNDLDDAVLDQQLEEGEEY